VVERSAVDCKEPRFLDNQPPLRVLVSKVEIRFAITMKPDKPRVQQNPKDPQSDSGCGDFLFYIYNYNNIYKNYF